MPRTDTSGDEAGHAESISALVNDALARTGRADAIGAAMVCLAADGDDILTSDRGDLRVLAEVADVPVELILV